MAQEIMTLSIIGAKRTGEHAGGIKQIYSLSDADRNLLRAVYGNPEYGNTTDSIDYLVDKLGIPRNRLRRWAAAMGLTRTRDDHWTPEDLAYLQENYQRPSGKRASIKSIAAHLGRTEAAVRLKAKRMKFRRTTGDVYTVHGLADALGCDWHKIERWIQLGWLGAPLDKSRDDGRRAIKPDEIRRFIIAYPSEIDHRKADWIWLLDILVGNTDRIGGPEPRGPKAGRKPAQREEA